MSSVGTSPGGVPAGNLTSTTNTGASRQTGGIGPAGSARIASAGYVPNAETVLRGGYGSGQGPAAIGPNRSLFSHTDHPSAESLNALQHELELLSQKLSRILDSPSHSAYAPAAPQTRVIAAADDPYPDLGSHPFMTRPTGTGPTGSFDFNPQ